MWAEPPTGSKRFKSGNQRNGNYMFVKSRSFQISRQNLVTFARRRETYTERRNYQFSYIQWKRKNRSGFVFKEWSRFRCFRPTRYRLQRKELSDYDVLLTIGFKYRRYSLQRWTGISTYFRKRRAGSIRYWGLPCCNNRRWFLPYFHRSIVGSCRSWTDSHQWLEKLYTAWDDIPTT